MQNSGHLSADRWRTHFARTNNNFYYFYLGAHAKPYDNPFWGFEQRYQEKKINYLK
jgi:hypothetical protein